jgi:hypothetical protein
MAKTAAIRKSRGRKEMEAIEVENTIQNQKKSTDKRTRNSLYQAVWRWHFYAGLIFAPFLIILAVTGSIYLLRLLRG